MNRREKTLLLVVGLLLFSFANLVAGKWWSSRYADLKGRHHKNELELIEAEALFDARDESNKRNNWLQHNLGNFPGQEKADALLLETIEVSAKNAKIKIEAIELLPAPTTADSGRGFQRSAVSVRAVGSLDRLGRWLHSFQQPDVMRQFAEFQLSRTKDQPGILECRFQCWQWYARPPAENPGAKTSRLSVSKHSTSSTIFSVNHTP